MGRMVLKLLTTFIATGRQFPPSDWLHIGRMTEVLAPDI
jgi:hypothetical protein